MLFVSCTRLQLLTDITNLPVSVYIHLLDDFIDFFVTELLAH